MTTLLFIPCCKSKSIRQDDAKPAGITEERLSGAYPLIRRGRERLGVDASGPSGAAVLSYAAHFYRAAPLLRQAAREGPPVTIIRAGYGLVGLADPIRPYDRVMAGEVAELWRTLGLPEAIGELIRVSGADRVFGFFAGSGEWTGPGSKYRWFFEEGIRRALRTGRVG